MTNILTHTHNDDRSELLSGYLDNALDVAARQQAERTLKSCAACAEELDDLRSLQVMLRALPAPMPRRSFTIDPATVRPHRLLFPIFRFASLAAAVMLFVVLGIDALPSNNASTATTMMEPYTAKQAPAAGGAPESYSAQAQLEPTIAPPAVAMAPAPQTTMAAESAAEAPTAAAAAAAAPAAEATATDAGAPVADAAATTESADTTMMPMDAPEGAQALRQSDQATAEAAGGNSASATEPLQSSENAAAETDQLTTTAAEPTPPIDIWRMVAYVLAIFAIGLGGAWWWTARKGI